MSASVATKHGYASAAVTQGGYPTFTPDATAAAAADLQLKPNRRPLFIGLAIVLVGVVAIIVVMANSSSTDDAASVSPTNSDHAATDNGSAAVAGSDNDENMVSVVIKSDPPGADVLITGEKVGVTPFVNKLHRAVAGTKLAPLTVHKDGYVDFTSKIDLTGDYENSDIHLTHAEAGSGSDAKKPNDPSPASKSTKAEPGHDKADPAHDKADPAHDKAEPTHDKADAARDKEPAHDKAEATQHTDPAHDKAHDKVEPAHDKAAAAHDKADPAHDKAAAHDKADPARDKADPARDKAADKPADKSGAGDKASAKQPKCQPPGPNLDPFLPVCKS